MGYLNNQSDIQKRISAFLPKPVSDDDEVSNPTHAADIYIPLEQKFRQVTVRIPLAYLSKEGLENILQREQEKHLRDQAHNREHRITNFLGRHRPIVDEVRSVTLTSPLGYLAPIIWPWAAGRQAGVSAYARNNLPSDVARGTDVLAPEFSSRTFENHALRQMVKNPVKEGTGVLISLLPTAAMIPIVSATTSGSEISNAVAILTLGAQVVGGYLFSRYHAKNTLGPAYEASFKEEQEVRRKAAEEARQNEPLDFDM